MKRRTFIKELGLSTSALSLAGCGATAVRKKSAISIPTGKMPMKKLGKTDIALKHYKKAIAIEQAYRRKFRQMFPDKELVSRLGDDKYNFATQRVEELSK